MLDKIKKLREITGAGVMEVKQALDEAAGEEKVALDILKKRGAAVAKKRSGRSTSQGLIDSYIHLGKIGVLMEINCETDFVAKCDEFKKFAREVTLQAASVDAQSVDELLNSRYFRDEDKTIEGLLEEVIAKTGENIRIKRFARFALSEK